MPDELRLNSLDRFRKQPARLVLEAHSHCEVPAGCGGVVLRWRNPLAGIPVIVRLYSPVQPDWFLNGEHPPTARIDLLPGRHVLAIALEGVNLAVGLLMFAATHEPKKYQPVAPAEVHEPPFKVLSAGDGSWKFTLADPGEGWQAAGFDDRAWPALVQTATPKLDWTAFGATQCHYCKSEGAACLGLPALSAADEAAVSPVSWWQRLTGRRSAAAGASGIATVWIRKVFDVPAPELRADVKP